MDYLAEVGIAASSSRVGGERGGEGGKDGCAPSSSRHCHFGHLAVSGTVVKIEIGIGFGRSRNQ